MIAISVKYKKKNYIITLLQQTLTEIVIWAEH